MPDCDYKNLIVEGAKRWQLPADYIQELEENSGWIGHNGQIPGYFIFEVYNPELDATIVIALEGALEVAAKQSIKPPVPALAHAS